MSEINRSLAIVKAKQPFIDWAHSVDEDPDYDVEDFREDSSAYLIPEFEDDQEQREILEEFYQPIFEEELNSWCLDESTWPQKRDLAMFLEWFDIEFHSLVYDLAEGLPLQEVEYPSEVDE